MCARRSVSLFLARAAPAVRSLSRLAGPVTGAAGVWACRGVEGVGLNAAWAGARVDRTTGVRRREKERMKMRRIRPTLPSRRVRPHTHGRAISPPPTHTYASATSLRSPVRARECRVPPPHASRGTKRNPTRTLPLSIIPHAPFHRLLRPRPRLRGRRLRARLVPAHQSAYRPGDGAQRGCAG